MLTKKFAAFALLQFVILLGVVWFIAGNDRLFRNTVPVEQRLVSRNESIRKKAQQELLGLGADEKRLAVSRLIPALGQDDAFVRKWAAISLALVGPAAQEAIPALLQNVSSKEKDAAQAARVALSEIGAPDAQQLPTLLQTLQDPRESVRCEAARSIGKMGPAAQEAVATLSDLIRRPGESPACFEESLASLASTMPSIVSPIIDLLDNPRVDLRRKAAHVLELSGVKTPETIVRLLDKLSQEADPAVRKSLARALRLPFTPQADRTAVLSSALHDDYAPVRLEAARWIRANAPKGQKSLPLIVRMLGDPDPAIRRLSLETLRRSGARGAELMRRVAKAQRDPDAGVRCRACETLIEAGATDRVSIALLIGDLKKDEDTARCAEDVLSLAGLFDPDVIHSMMRLVQEEKDPDLRSRAARVLMHLGPRARQAIPALVRAQKDDVPGASIALKAVRTPFSKRRN